MLSDCVTLYCLCVAASESCVRLLDIDEDGRDDIIVGSAKAGLIANTRIHREEMKKQCHKASYFHVEMVMVLRELRDQLFQFVSSFFSSVLRSILHII